TTLLVLLQLLPSYLSSCLCFFVLMVRRPPTSTLFPYTRSSDLRHLHLSTLYLRHQNPTQWAERRNPILRRLLLSHLCRRNHLFRSEEHTSELQSRENLVCRLLLEKKKKI